MYDKIQKEIFLLVLTLKCPVATEYNQLFVNAALVSESQIYSEDASRVFFGIPKHALEDI